MYAVQWVKSSTGTWLPFETANLAGIESRGVYVIWFARQGHNVVKVGQGKVTDRIGAHRNDARIIAYRNTATLLLTWAELPADQRDGVERYLADLYQPLVGDAYPNVVPTAVNLPS